MMGELLNAVTFGAAIGIAGGLTVMLVGVIGDVIMRRRRIQ